MNKALAEIVIDRAIPPLFEFEDRLTTDASHINSDGTDGGWTYDPRVLRHASSEMFVLDEDKLTQAALLAYPDDAPKIVEAVRAAKALLPFFQKYSQAPWERAERLQSGFYQTSEMDRAINRLLASLGAIPHLLPHLRK